MSNSEPEYITIGIITSPWGIHGQIKIDVETDFPQRFSRSSRVYIGGQLMVIDDVSWHKGKAIIKLDGVDDTQDAEKLNGQPVEVHRSQLYELPENTFYHFQLIGLKVITTGGAPVGEISEVMTTASTDIYVIKGQKGDILVPATDEIIKSVDLDKGTLVIEPMRGLLDLNDKKVK